MSREEVASVIQELREFKDEFRAHREEVLPLLEALKFVQTIQKFAKWLGTSLILLAAGLYWIIRKI